MPPRQMPRPLAVLLCLAAAAILAFPTLALPADSPPESKTVYIVVGTALLISAMVRLRREIADPRPTSLAGGIRPTSGRYGDGGRSVGDHEEGLGGDVPGD